MRLAWVIRASEERAPPGVLVLASRRNELSLSAATDGPEFACWRSKLGMETARPRAVGPSGTRAAGPSFPASPGFLTSWLASPSFILMHSKLDVQRWAFGVDYPSGKL